MDWKQIIADLRAAMTLQEISTKTGMSKGAVHDLGTGRAGTVVYETGCKLVDLHRSLKRRADRKKASLL